MSHAQRYRCTGCGTEQFLPERPSDAPLSVRAGCETCNAIQRHEKV